MTQLPITLTRFHVNRKAYAFEDAYVASLNTCDTCVPISQHMDDTFKHMVQHPDQPTGWSFARWKKGNNQASNLIENFAIVLEYPAAALERLETKLRDLGWQHFFISTESRSGTRNTITVVVPLTSAVNTGQYARIASILTEQLDEYDMEEGCLAPTHIFHVHRTSAAVVVPGTILDPEAFIKKTKDDYQRLRSRRFELKRPVRAADVHLNEPIWTQDDTGLFEFMETPAERILRQAGIPLR